MAQRLYGLPSTKHVGRGEHGYGGGFDGIYEDENQRFTQEIINYLSNRGVPFKSDGSFDMDGWVPKCQVLKETEGKLLKMVEKDSKKLYTMAEAASELGYPEERHDGEGSWRTVVDDCLKAGVGPEVFRKVLTKHEMSAKRKAARDRDTTMYHKLIDTAEARWEKECEDSKLSPKEILTILGYYERSSGKAQAAPVVENGVIAFANKLEREIKTSETHSKSLANPVNFASEVAASGD